MTHVVSVFRDRPAAEAAALRLADVGVPMEHVHVLNRGRRALNKTAIDVDELVTGGIFHDVGKLIDDVFGQRKDPEKAATYEEAVRMDEVVAVIVDADSPDELERAEVVLREAGARHVVRP